MIAPRILQTSSALSYALWTVLLCLVTGVSVQAQTYRYLDENGHQQYSHSVPAERARYGYEVLDDQGIVVESVGPQLSDEEYEKRLALEAARQVCERALRRVRNMYQNIDDVDYAESQAIRSIDIRISNARSTLTHVVNQKKELESQAAQIDIAGKVIPPKLLENIETAKEQQAVIEKEITQREAEKEALTQEFNTDRAVFVLQTCEDGLPAHIAALGQ